MSNQAVDLLNTIGLDDAQLGSGVIGTMRLGSDESGNIVGEGHIVIGTDRIIVVPDTLKRIAVQHDHNIETVTFDCPRYWDQHDLSKMKIYINYKCPDDTKGLYLTTDVVVDEKNPNIIHFNWTISRNVTTVEGKLEFLVCAKTVDGEGNETVHWNSEKNSDMFISEGFECSEPIIEDHPDIITDLLMRMSRLELGAGNLIVNAKDGDNGTLVNNEGERYITNADVDPNKVVTTDDIDVSKVVTDDDIDVNKVLTTDDIDISKVVTTDDIDVDKVLTTDDINIDDGVPMIGDTKTTIRTINDPNWMLCDGNTKVSVDEYPAFYNLLPDEYSAFKSSWHEVTVGNTLSNAEFVYNAGDDYLYFYEEGNTTTHRCKPDFTGFETFTRLKDGRIHYERNLNMWFVMSIDSTRNKVLIHYSTDCFKTDVHEISNPLTGYVGGLEYGITCVSQYNNDWFICYQPKNPEYMGWDHNDVLHGISTSEGIPPTSVTCNTDIYDTLEEDVRGFEEGEIRQITQLRFDRDGGIYLVYTKHYVPDGNGTDGDEFLHYYSLYNPNNSLTGLTGNWKVNDLFPDDYFPEYNLFYSHYATSYISYYEQRRSEGGLFIEKSRRMSLEGDGYINSKRIAHVGNGHFYLVYNNDRVVRFQFNTDTSFLIPSSFSLSNIMNGRISDRIVAAGKRVIILKDDGHTCIYIDHDKEERKLPSALCEYPYKTYIKVK